MSGKRRARLVCALAIAAAGAGAYALAGETSVFAVESIEVRGAPPVVAAEVRVALASYRGRSLVGLDGHTLERRVEALPTVFAVSYDRAFPHTLRLVVRAERAAVEIRAKIAELQSRRKNAQPTNKRTFGSVFKNPEHDLTAGRMLEACGLKGHRIGGAQISPKHANFIENADDARTEDAVALMVEARRRAHEQYGVVLRHEVEFLGIPDLPPVE